MTAPVPAGDGIGGLCDRLEEAHVSDGYADGPECRGCRADCLYCEGDHPWPCDVVALVAAARERDRLRAAVDGLAERLEVRVANRGRPAPGTYDHGVNRAQTDVAISLRNLLADTTGEA